MRVSLTVALVVAGVIGVGQASAAFSPRFGVTSTAKSVTVTFKQPAGDDPAASLLFFVPINYAGDLGNVGFRVGKATATISGAAMTGTIDPANATDAVPFGATSSPLSTIAGSCSGTATHDGFWVLNLASSAQKLQLPVVVDRVPAADPLASAVWFRLLVCLPPPGSPAATLTDLSLVVNGFYSQTPGWHPWFLQATPYAAATGKASPPAAVEVQSLDRTPVALTLVARRGGSVTGRLTAGGNGKALGGQTVEIKQGAKVVARATTRSDGSYRATIKRAAGGTVTAGATVPLHDVSSSCRSVVGTPACIAVTSGGFTAASKPAKLP